MEAFFLSVISNALVALLMAVGIVVLSVRLKRPAVLHLLWLLILVKLFVPPILAFGVLPASERGKVTIEASAITLVPGDAEDIPEPLGTKAIVGWTLVGVWALGSLLMLGVTLVRQRRFSILLAQSEPASRELVHTIEELASAIGCRRRPLVLITDASVSPLVWSCLGRPRIVLPKKLMNTLDERQRDTILAHELAHLKRGDDRVRWIELAAMIVFWWNPTTWWASRCLRDAEEECCDALVAEALPDHVKSYATGLVETIRHLSHREPSHLVAASGLGRAATIEGRIRVMFTDRGTSPLSLSKKSLVILAAVFALGLSPMLTAREGSVEDHAMSAKGLSGDPISLSLNDADVRDVMATFEHLSNTKIVVDPDVSEKITVELKDIPQGQALDLILRMTGLSASVKDGVIYVEPGRALDVFEEGLITPQANGEFEGRPLYRYNVGGPITEPMRLDGPNPRYPVQARDEGINGVVVMDCVIAEDGSVRDVEVVKSNAHILSEAAVEAVEQWTFVPATLDGIPVPTRYTLTVRFNLK